MGEALGNHVAPAFHLKLVIADLAGCLKRLLNIANLEEPLPLCTLRSLRPIRPDSRQAVCLQFQSHRGLVGEPLAGTLLVVLYLPGNIKEVLHVVADLMGDHIRLSKIPRRAESITEFLK